MKALTTLPPAIGLSISLTVGLPGCSDTRRTSTSEEPAAPSLREPAPSPKNAKNTTSATERTLAEASALLWPRTHEDRFTQTTTREHDAAEPIVQGVLAALSDGSSPDFGERVGELGMKTEEWIIDGRRVLVLRERDSDRHGRGVYLFRRDPQTPSAQPLRILQAPHAYFDKGTGALALELLVRGDDDARPDALFANSMHRYGRPGTPTPAKHAPTDLAHNPDHFFSALTRALVGSAQGAEVVQLHGFARSRGRDEGEGEVHAVVSAGLPKRSSQRARDVAAAMHNALAGVRVYPDQVDWLGATTNVQGKLVRAIPQADFLHIELSSSARRRLAEDARLLSILGASIWSHRDH